MIRPPTVKGMGGRDTAPQWDGSESGSAGSLRSRGRMDGPTVADMWTIIGVLLLIWLVVSVFGFVLEGLLWLGIIGLVLFGGTLLFGFIRGRSAGSR